MKKILSLSLIFLSINIQAQSLKVGEWRDHLSYKSTYDVCQIGNKIYTSTDKAIFVYDINDNSVERINTLNDLSDTEVSTIESDGENLIVCYANGNLDIINSGKTHNLPDIKRASLIGDKRINHINIIDHIAYLGCGFGIVVLDTERREIKDTYLIGNNGAQINILSTCFAHNNLYAATESGIYKANINHPNLTNYEAWTKIDAHSNSRISHLTAFSDLIIVNLQGELFNTDTLYTFNGEIWALFDQNHSNVSLKSSDTELTITRRYGINIFDTELNQTRFLSSAEFNLAKTDFRSSIFTQNKEYWITDKYNGLLHFDQGFHESIQPSGPYISEVAQIKNFGDEIWLAHGDKNENWDPTWTKSELSILKEDLWSTSNTILDNDIMDIVAINQHEGHTYIASWQNGIVSLVGTDWETLFDTNNSSLQKRAIHEDWINIGDIQFDSEGNLWCTNSQTYEPISVKYTNGDWESYSLGSSVTEHQNIAKMIIDKNDQKWIQLRDNGMVVFDEQRSGTKTRKLTNSESGGNLASDRIFSFIEDLDGEIWVGTDNGVSVFYDPGYIFEGENASQITVTLDGHNTYLLKGQRINDIEVDGANRKWFATNNSGVIVTSENGTEEIHHFTTDNSPIFSNKIIDIEFNDQSGEVFIATDKGLISFRSKATKGNSDFADVLVFPNPVKPDYEGPITIKGLVTDAVVKITDISGNLIYETVALGGQAVWDGKSFEGKRAHSGVYLIFCSDEDGKVTHVSKLLFIRG